MQLRPYRNTSKVVTQVSIGLSTIYQSCGRGEASSTRDAKEEVEHVLTLKKKVLVDLLVSMGIDADCIKKAKFKADLIALYRKCS